jgi:hypothetical protein
MALLRANGMKALVQADERTRFTGIGSETAGWLLADEIDMTGGPPACHGSLETVKNSLPADGRARYNNYGKGVLLWQSDAEAACFIDAQELVSSDLYWHTDPEAARGRGRSAAYGRTVDRQRFLDGLDGERKPIWNVVETGWPWSENPARHGGRIMPAEARAAVWHSIIAGARGIVYFDHQWGGACDQSVIRGECYRDTGAALKATNRRLSSLAPVLNSPTVTSGHSASSAVRTMVKWDGANLYVFAGSSGSGSTASVSIPCVGNATATVLGESRAVPVSNGTFSDGFADGNAIHIYRIDGGSTCGLAAGG